jgi:hypothetical protein
LIVLVEDKSAAMKCNSSIPFVEETNRQNGPANLATEQDVLEK